MAAQDKLIPTALLLANNLKGTAYQTKNTYKLPAKKASKFQNPYTDAVEFFADIYQREILVTKQLEGTTPTASQIFSKQYTPNQNNRSLTIGMVVAFSEAEWNELQIAIARCFNTVYPFDIPSGPWTPTEITQYNDLMGTVDGGVAPNLALAGADSSPLGIFAQGIPYANAWNNLKVPYDASIGVVTPYMAPIFKPVGATKFYYRYTGNRRWFGFAGYNS